ncbi:putative 6-phosphogluconate dehydrogenase, NADP-binding, NAD(P)-binding domain superfamily [Helianthus annuus]|nr:putative 6-phosphogluconate dehydrogenase, NADP-binding, NAD(P)-binding domain superfamily [Helianthus annuus]
MAKHYKIDYYNSFWHISKHPPLKVGFIGLGNMGSRMANNLIKAGYNVAVHDMYFSHLVFFFFFNLTCYILLLLLFYLYLVEHIMQSFTFSHDFTNYIFSISNLSVLKMFSDKGITIKGSPMEVAEISDVVITMLPSPSHVLNVYTGPNGLLNGGNPVKPWLFIDSSTIDPQTTRKISSAVSNRALIEKNGI